MSLDVSLEATRIVDVFTYNITHNLGKMADRADLYKPLWRPEELDIHYADELEPYLEAGLEKLLEDPEKFESLNPANGWGTYDDLVKFVKAYIQACKENPDAVVYADR